MHGCMAYKPKTAWPFLHPSVHHQLGMRAHVCVHMHVHVCVYATDDMTIQDHYEPKN